jgi:hypothetical protein
MRSTRRAGLSRTLVAAALASAAVLAGAEPPPIPLERFREIHDLIKPGPGEARWAEIPWMACLWEARKKAAAEGKPLLLWMATEGNPVGMT